MVTQTLTMLCPGVALALPHSREYINCWQGRDGIHHEQLYVIGDSPVTLSKSIAVAQEWVIGHQPFPSGTVHLSCNCTGFDRYTSSNRSTCA